LSRGNLVKFFQFLRNENLGKLPTIYICIEQKNREYDEKLLLASELSLNGFRCYVGTHEAIWRLLQSKKDNYGIYLDKGTQPIEKMKWIKTACQYLVVMDVELGPVVQDMDLMFSSLEGLPNLNRLYPGSENLVDSYLCIGPKVFDGAKAAFANDKAKVVMTGWPRMDLWQKFGGDLYSKEITRIVAKMGEFLLFASNYTWLSSPGPQNASDGDWEMRKEAFSNFQKAIQILKVWDKEVEIPRIIVRPHISEDIKVWKKELRGLTKTHVIHQGDILPWIHASKGVIHTGSTSVVQAELARKPSYFLSEAAVSYTSDLSKQISTFQVSLKQGPKLHRQLSEKKVSDSNKTKLLESVLFFSKQGATLTIVDFLSSLNTVPSSEISRAKLFFAQISFKSAKRSAGLFKHELLWALGLTQNPSQLHNTPFGLGILPIKRMIRLKPSYRKLKVRAITINLWEISL
jgi:surface carbohydrate biosynthesis protein